MTTQKAQSKIKTSTIAITILSVLLAVAVASTIVLAAFSANKQASTTITFSGGLAIDVTNVTATGSENLAWFTTVDGTEKTEANLTATNSVTFKAISTNVNADSDIDTAYVIAYAAITANGITGADTNLEVETGWAPISGKAGWYVYGTEATPQTITTTAIPFVKAKTFTADNNYASGTLTGTVKVFAVDSGAFAAPADALTQLKTDAGISA